MRSVVTALALVSLLVPARAEDPAPLKDTINESLPDPAYKPKRGDRATVAFQDPKTRKVMPFPIATSERVWRDFGRASEIGDQDGINELIRTGEVYIIPLGAPVLVLEVEEHPVDGEKGNRAVVRILSGQHKSEKGWTAALGVVKLIPNPDYVPPKKR